MRLIDADTLKQTFCAECDHSIKCEDCDIDYHFEHLASPVDAIEVVRCKDCCHCIHNEFLDTYCCWKFSWSIPTEKDSFCSCGERREDGKTN